MQGDPVDVLVLGPTLVRAGDTVLPVDRPLERALLVRLAMGRGTAVPDQRLAGDLWGDRELGRPVERLRVVVSRLRSSLGPHAGLISRSAAGYRLASAPTDLVRAEAAAERLHAAERIGDHAKVRDASATALAYWRGPALADLRMIRYARVEGERLDDWRLTLTVARLGAELHLGAAGAVTAELSALVAEHPLHEPLTGLLALALYRTGRQADALARLARLRRALADELGVNPGPESARLELRLLRQDPSLLPTPTPVNLEPTAPTILLPRRLDVPRATAAGLGEAVEQPRRPAAADPHLGVSEQHLGVSEQQLGAAEPARYAGDARPGAGDARPGAGGLPDIAVAEHGQPGATVLRLPARAPAGPPDTPRLRGFPQRPLAMVRTPADPPADRVRARLPIPETALVGRDGDRAALRALLRGPAMVTLVGPPGGGKSRLALEVAREVADGGRRTVFVQLAPLGREEEVVSAVAEAAGVARDSANPLSRVGAALHGALLVLDHADHLGEQVCSVVAGLRRSAPGLSVLVTSTRALLVADEVPHRVGPLSRAHAVALFTDRAGRRRLGPGGSAAGSGRADAARICASMDGLPLGIELAAGLARSLPVAQLAGRVAGQLRLLAGRASASGRPHTSLRAALDWSYQLLDPRERVVLRRLGVFAGDFTMDAAGAVVRGGPIELGDVAPAVAELVARGLVSSYTEAGRRRLALLETVQAYALAQLGATGETEGTRTRHLSWCLGCVRASASSAATAGVPPGPAGVSPGISAVGWPNLAAALELAAGQARAADGLRLALALDPHWLAAGRFEEAHRHYAALVDAAGATRAERAEAFSNLGWHVARLGRFGEAVELLARAADLLDGGSDQIALTIRYRQGRLELGRGRLPSAVAALRAGLALAHRSGSPRQRDSVGATLGAALLIAGDADGALEAYRGAALAGRECGDERALALGLHREAAALLAAGRTDAAVRLISESDRYASLLADRRLLRGNELIRAQAARADGDLAAAERHARKALGPLQARLSDNLDTTEALARIELADVLVDTGALVEARALLEARGLLDAPREHPPAKHALPEHAFPEHAFPEHTRTHALPEYAAERAGQPAVLLRLAARPVASALALAEGDRVTAERLVARAEAEFASSGFGWARYAARLAEVRHRLDTSAGAGRPPGMCQ
ncbi:MAG TPA: BTAD domain-containing putative transcriptional regulator [Pseudonocardia sp.]|uniref:AfsR/SARP family transcriptional regulator n=1 Tax=Pseudonocardia sp. TaxID=60912 RepID=UPI002ED81932